MPSKITTAKADPASVPKAGEAAKPGSAKKPIKANIARMPRGPHDKGPDHPAVLFKGDVPTKGGKLYVRLDNGFVYSGIVADATDVEGEVLVEFRDGLAPERK